MIADKLEKAREKKQLSEGQDKIGNEKAFPLCRASHFCEVMHY